MHLNTKFNYVSKVGKNVSNGLKAEVGAVDVEVASGSIFALKLVNDDVG